jgi:GMP synthase (glutamine-hydrolysing)
VSFPGPGLTVRILGEVPLWQAFAVLLPVRIFGSAAGRFWAGRPAISSCAEGPASIPTRAIHEVKGVNRVVYDVSSKPPSTIEWE